MWMGKSIKSKVNYYTRKFGTRNPFKIAKELDVLVKVEDIGDCPGCYMYLNRHRCIFLNNGLSEFEMRFVMAHELGHAVLHRLQQSYFMRNKTLLLTSPIEREANTFAAELLISDDDIEVCETIGQISSITGIPEEIVKLRFEK